MLRKIADAGIKISIYDFVISYSSLSYSSNLPDEVVNIERSFISNKLSNARMEVLIFTMFRILMYSAIGWWPKVSRRLTNWLA